jgi:hypothetical protein
MSDTEEVIIKRREASVNDVKEVKTKPEIAREKLKEKRERLKKEKENGMIEEAKKRLALDLEKKKAEEEAAVKAEEEKKKADPTYMLMKKMEDMMASFAARQAPPPITVPEKAAKKAKKEAKVEIPEEEEKPKRKPRAKEIVDKPNPSKGLPKQRKKVVYLQQEPVPEQSTQFVGYDIAPPQEQINYQSPSGLLSALMSRRNMNSAY